MFVTITIQLVKMFIIMAIGVLAYRRKLIDQAGNQTLANLLLTVVNPILALMCQQIDYEPRLIRGLLIAYALAVLSHIAAIIIAGLLIHKKDNPRYEIERFAVIYTNCGFLGIPLVRSVLGAEGVFYLTAYITVFNIFSWTHGLMLMTGKTSWRDLKKGMLNPVIIAALLGLALFFARIRIPAVIADGLNYVGDMNTPLAMLIAGVSVAQVDFRSLSHGPRILYITIVKLLIVPLVFFPVLMLVKGFTESTVLLTILIAAACPTGATSTMFALRFGKDYKYASEVYAITTIGALVTIPLFGLLGDLLF